MMIAKLMRHTAAFMLFASGAAAFGQSLPAPPPGYTPPPQPWATFNFASNNVNNNVSDGNSRTYTATSSLYGTFNVRITAWTLEKVCTGGTQWGSCLGYTTYVRDSKLVVYDGGLGVISGDDDGGSNGQHTIDNEGRRDFLVFQFDRQVELVAAVFNTYSVNGQSQNDSDVTVKYGEFAPAWNASLTSTLNDKTETQFNALWNGTYQSNISNGGADNARWINTGRNWGDTWMIGASFANPDSKIDGFKLESLSIVPEPQTWAMMIAGFGVVGGAMRSTRRREVALQA